MQKYQSTIISPTRNSPASKHSRGARSLLLLFSRAPSVSRAGDYGCASSKVDRSCKRASTSCFERSTLAVFGTALIDHVVTSSIHESLERGGVCIQTAQIAKMLLVARGSAGHQAGVYVNLEGTRFRPAHGYILREGNGQRDICAKIYPYTESIQNCKNVILAIEPRRSKAGRPFMLVENASRQPVFITPNEIQLRAMPRIPTSQEGRSKRRWGQRRYSWRLLGDGDGLAPQAFDSLRLSDPAADGREATQK